MKFVILVICGFLQLPSPNDAQNKISRYGEAWKTCAEGFSDKEIESLFENGKEVKDEKLRCVPKCVMKKLGFMDDSNKINYEAFVKEEIEETTLEQKRAVADGCKQSVDPDGCKVAHAFISCAVNKVRNW